MRDASPWRGGRLAQVPHAGSWCASRTSTGPLVGPPLARAVVRGRSSVTVAVLAIATPPLDHLVIDVPDNVSASRTGRVGVDRPLPEVDRCMG